MARSRTTIHLLPTAAITVTAKVGVGGEAG
jgi:hypothetical protein